MTVRPRVPQGDEATLVRHVREALESRDPDACLFCNGMGGVYMRMNGGRSFVNCPECKGSGKRRDV